MRQQLRKLSVSMLNSPNKFKLDNRTRKQSCTIIRSRYKLTKKAYMMRLDPQNSIIKNTKFKLIRSGKLSQSTNNSSDKLKKTPMLVRKKKFTKRNLVKINKRKLQKNNIPCEIYNKRGTCKGLANGKCSKKHDPNQIQICVWFLQGICRDDKCTLSHKASPEKMPTCKFYLEGICHKDNCPYLHVKLSRNAPVCRDFINGYCAKARECDKRHQFLCPDFERDGKCSKKLCRYPHGKAVRQYKDTLLNVIARNRKSKVQRKGKAQPVNNKVRAHVKTENKQDNVDNKRYYECPSSVANGVSNVGENVEDSEEIEEVGSIFDRPKLGALPSFISL
ncbi:zinc finger CCCH domain-containing protein 3-like [Atheta coriaria]|uniref:zinc finger CCCH domain-containing protein 3-like n=1 Tax=Dalotia coriaria TaxID=877792 RepID=UPI0031F3A2DE